MRPEVRVLPGPLPALTSGNAGDRGRSPVGRGGCRTNNSTWLPFLVLSRTSRATYCSRALCSKKRSEETACPYDRQTARRSRRPTAICRCRSAFSTFSTYGPDLRRRSTPTSCPQAGPTAAPQSTAHPHESRQRGGVVAGSASVMLGSTAAVRLRRSATASRETRSTSCHRRQISHHGMRSRLAGYAPSVGGHGRSRT
jgi:hypothetical protein